MMRLHLHGPICRLLEVLLHHARLKARRWNICSWEDALVLTPQAISRCRSRLTCLNIYNSSGKSQKHGNSHLWVSEKHIFPLWSSSWTWGQMALGLICWLCGVTLHDCVKAPVDFPSTQSIASDASRCLALRRTWCKCPFILNIYSYSGFNLYRFWLSKTLFWRYHIFLGWWLLNTAYATFTWHTIASTQH